MSYIYKPLGDSGVLVVIGNSISPEINKKVRAFTLKVERKKIDGVLEMIPAYADVLIHYNPFVISLKDLLAVLKALELDSLKGSQANPKTLIVPVCYERNYAPDMKVVCGLSGLSKDEVIIRHTSTDYLVYMLGFTPGFCYLGGLDNRLAMPRRKNPRLKIPGGAVGIAGDQTGIYPIESPGGWQIIGQTPLPMFQVGSREIFPVQQGDFVRFKSISNEGFELTKSRVEKGLYPFEYS